MSSGRLEAAHEEVAPRAVVARQVDLPSRLGAARCRRRAANRRRGGPRLNRLRRLAPDPLRLPRLGRGAGDRAGSGAWRARTAALVRAAGAPVHRRHGDLPDDLRSLHRLHRLEPQRAGRPSLQRPRQSAHALGRFLLLERARQHGLLCRDRPRPVRDRLRPGARCSTPTFAAASSSASPSSCRSC